MKLLKAITLFAFLFSVTSSCAQWGKKERGNGDITTITRSTSDYDGIKTAGPMDFKLVEGREGSITINGDSNLLDYIITEVKGGNLVVKVKDGYNIKPSKTITVTIPYESISSVSLAGSGDVENSGTINANNFKVALAGSGNISLKVNAKDVNSSIAGSGDINIDGSTSNLEVKIAGSGDFDGEDLASTDVTAKITGSGSAKVVCNGKLTAKITGSGDVKYSGNPTNKNTKITGSGSISN